MFIHLSKRYWLLAPCLVLALGACGSKDSDGPSPRDLARASAFYQEALLALEEGRNVEAIVMLNQGLKRDPESEVLHSARSEFGDRVSLYEEVIVSSEWLLVRDPGNPELIARILRAGLNGGHVDVARKALNRLKRAAPGTATTETLAAQLFLETGDLQAAERHAKKSIELVPEQTAAHNVIGLAREFAGELELAIESYRRVIFVDPGHLGARDHLATLLLRLERRKESRKHRDIHTTLIKAMPGAFRHFPPATRIKSFTGVIEILPEWALGHMELGRALMQNQQFDDSLVRLNRALELDPRNAKIHELMASLLRRMGDDEGADRHAKLAGTPWNLGAKQ